MSDSSKKATYDEGHSVTLDKLRRKNEGWNLDEEDLEPKGPVSSAPGSYGESDVDRDYRASMSRASRRFRDLAEERGVLNRQRRHKVEVPTKEESMRILLLPFLLALVFVVNYFVVSTGVFSPGKPKRAASESGVAR